MSLRASLFSRIIERYDVETERVGIAGSEFDVLRVRDTNKLLEKIDPETFARDERLPYWAELWASSLALATSCLREIDLRGKCVLELGCGLGLAGIAAARAGASVTMTDYESDALLFAEYNTLTNLAPRDGISPCRSSLLDWRDPEVEGTFDVILGADIIYEEVSHAPILALLDRSLAPGGFACIADPGRRTAPLFTSLAASRGYAVEEHASTVRLHDQDVAVNRYLLRRKTAFGLSRGRP